MTIEEYRKLKQQKQASSSATTTPKKKKEEDKAYARDFLGTELSFLNEPDTIKQTSYIPDWKTGNGLIDFVGNNVVNASVRPFEQFVRMIPATMYEVGRAGIGAATDYKAPISTSENPFVPGLEKTSGMDAAKLALLRGGKAMLSALLLRGGGKAAMGGGSVKSLAGQGAKYGAVAPLTQEEAPTIGDIALSSGAGSIIGPVAGKALQYGGSIVNKLLNKADKNKLQEVTDSAMTQLMVVRNPTPAEIAMRKFRDRQILEQSRDVTSGRLPIGIRNPETGAIEVPPGGFGPFQPEGTQPLRSPIDSFALDGIGSRKTITGSSQGTLEQGVEASINPQLKEGDIPTADFATQLLESVLGKKKTLKLKKDFIEGQIMEPFPDTGTILQKPTGQRPQPVLGDYAIERPFVVDMPAEVQTIVNTMKPDAEDIVPKDIPISITNVPINKRNQNILQTASRLWRPMQTRIEKMGPAGQKLSKAIDEFRQSEYTMRGKVQVRINEAFKNLKLNDEEQINFWEAAQGLAQPVNQKVASAVEKSREFANHFYGENTKRGLLENMVDQTGSPIIDPDKYLSHMLNEKGWRAMEFDEGKFFEKMAKANMQPGDDLDDVMNQIISDWKWVESGRTPKSFFEKKRTWRIPPEYLERDPQKLWSSYNATASKRYALLEKFGEEFTDADELGTPRANYPKIKEFLGEILRGSSKDDAQYAQNALDLIIGRGPTDQILKKQIARLTEFQLVSKLSPITTIQNLSQGFNGGIYQHGFKYALQGLKDTFTKEGGDFATKTGLVGQGYYTPAHYNKMLKLWGKITGFPLSEDFNFRVITNSAKHFLGDMYKKLEANPNSKSIRKHFELHGLDADQLIKQGGPTEDDLLKGAFIVARDTVFPRLVEQAPMWTNNPAMKLMYQFQHFGLKQPQMLAKQFKVGKGHGLAALAKFMATSAVTGEVSADIWSLIKKRERPEAPIPRIAENILYAGAGGIPAEMMRGLSNGYFGIAGPFSGPTVAGAFSSASQIMRDLQAGEPGKAIEDVIRARVRGDIPLGGPPIPAGSFIERMIPREDLERKKDSSGFKRLQGPKGAQRVQRLN